jgi:hypothetical protein
LCSKITLPKWCWGLYAYKQQGADLDFKKDQLAIEAYVRMRCGWRDESEISEEEYLACAIEYIQENPFADEAVSLPREFLTYDRLSGEFTYWKRIPNTQFYWEPGQFWFGMRMSLWCNYLRLRNYRVTLRGVGEYFGLIDPAYDD